MQCEHISPLAYLCLPGIQPWSRRTRFLLPKLRMSCLAEKKASGATRAMLHEIPTDETETFRAALKRIGVERL